MRRAREKFFMLPKAVAARTDVSASAKIMLTVLMDRTGQNDFCWPALETLARDMGATKPTILRALKQLEDVGLVRRRRGSGRGHSNQYVVLEAKGNETLPIAPTETVTKRSLKGNETLLETVTKRSSNYTNRTRPKNQTKKTAAEKPPPADDNGASGIVGLWIDLYRQRVGRDYPATGKGQLGGTLKRLAAGRPEGELAGAVRNWFGRDRRDYGIALFKSKLEGGDVELVGRPDAPDDPLALHNGKLLEARQ